ncbi:MAG TPA: radical SAM family heme chaperone HemW [Gemmatimonadales bacterium]|nr:radical SAM family heme chaperone HemW [Gemmatimonadales bacterium]
MHLYIHVPFCARRCSYCDFAIAVRRDVPSERFADLVLREWAGWQSHAVWSRSPRISTLYFGGGTPSRLAPEAIARITEQVWIDRGMERGAEITLEANPDDVTPAAVEGWRAAGVNRVSLGAQSFDPAVLRWMHRTHDPRQIGRAVELIRAAGIGELSLDLIFGLPGILERDWPADLDQVLTLQPDHLSLYGLTIEARTPLARWAARGAVTPVDDDRYAAEFLVAHERLASAGYEHYEVSNYARAGRRARHNSAYWQRAPYIGLGPSAHSAMDDERRWNQREWAAYERRLDEGAPVVEGEERLGPQEIRLEELYLGLRTVGGLAAERIPAETTDRWIGSGWATRAEGRIRLTPEGWLRLDALVASVSG